MLRNNYRSGNLIGHYPFWIISPRNSTLFTRPFLAGRRARTGHETNPPPKRKEGSGEYIASHPGLWILLKAKPLKLLDGLQQIGGVLSRSVLGVISKAKWFAVKNPSTGKIHCYISQSDCALKIPQRYKNVVPDPPFPLEG